LCVELVRGNMNKKKEKVLAGVCCAQGRWTMNRFFGAFRSRLIASAASVELETQTEDEMELSDRSRINYSARVLSDYIGWFMASS
jgi:hypothetical protein